jgi:hypothetical protein
MYRKLKNFETLCIKSSVAYYLKQMEVGFIQNLNPSNSGGAHTYVVISMKSPMSLSDSGMPGKTTSCSKIAMLSRWPAPRQSPPRHRLSAVSSSEQYLALAAALRLLVIAWRFHNSNQMSGASDLRVVFLLPK